MERFDIAETSSRISRIDFRQIMVEDLDIDDIFIIDSIWRVLDVQKLNSISLMQFAGAMSVLLKGSYDELRAFCFDVYDLNGNRRITRDNARLLLKSALQTETIEELDGGDGGDSSLHFLLDLTFKKITAGGDSSSISEAQYQRAVLAEPLLMECFGQVLPFPEIVDGLLYDLAV